MRIEVGGSGSRLRRGDIWVAVGLFLAAVMLRLAISPAVLVGRVDEPDAGGEARAARDPGLFL